MYRAPLLCSVKTTEAIVKATLCLHNYLKTEMTNLYSPSNLTDRTEDGQFINGEWREITKSDKNLTPVGRMGSNIAPSSICGLRDNLADYLITPAGSVPWQFAYVNRGKY